MAQAVAELAQHKLTNLSVCFSLPPEQRQLGGVFQGLGHLIMFPQDKHLS